MDKEKTKRVDNTYGVKIAFLVLIAGSILAGVFLSFASFAILYILWEMIAKKKLTRREKIIGWILFIVGISFFGVMNYLRSI